MLLLLEKGEWAWGPVLDSPCDRPQPPASFTSPILIPHIFALSEALHTHYLIQP